MFGDGVEPGGFEEDWAEQTCTRQIQNTKQIAVVHNRFGLGMAVLSSILAQT
jgi:hypothetical protein